MATDADFTGLKGELLCEYYIARQESLSDDVTRTVTAKEVAGWLHEVELQLGKHELAGEATTYAKRLVEDGFDTVEGIAGLDVGDLTEAGMRKGDAKPLALMRNVSEKCTPSGGDDGSFNASGLASSAASGNTMTTEASVRVAMVESYAIAASRSGAQAAVQAIKATEPVPELKGKVATVKVTALVEWTKSISKHHSAKGTLRKVVEAMAKLFEWPAADTAWEQAQEDPMMFKIQDVDFLEKVKEGLLDDLWGTIEDSDPDTGTQAIAHLIKVTGCAPSTWRGGSQDCCHWEN